MKLRKITALALSIAIVCGAAQTFGNRLPDRIPTANAADTTVKYKCGDELDWELDAEGTLAITGKGDMYDFSVNGTPWHGNVNAIKKIVVGDEVTSIGARAFSSLANVTYVAIGDSVKIIGTSAFSGCNKLNSVTIPASVKSIGNDAFLETGVPVIGKFSDYGPWTYCAYSNLPLDINTDNADIQYWEYETKEAKNSPGDGWVQGELSKSVYEDSGAPYESDIELPTSETRVLLSYYYYHFCSGARGNEGNYGFDDVFNHWDALNANDVYEVQTGLDSADNRYRYYYLKWKGTDNWAYCRSGVSCDGSHGEHGDRCFVWYRRSTYQDKALVNYYKYYKEVGSWSDIRNTNRALSSCRYRLKSDAPVTTTSAATTTLTTTTTATSSTKLTTTTVKTTTTAIQTTSVATTVATTTAPVQFTWGHDNWNFINNILDFRETTYRTQISGKYLDKFKKSLNNQEYIAMFNGYYYDDAFYSPWIDEKWSGSCYGMSSLILLEKNHVFTPSDVIAGKVRVFDLPKPVNSKDVESLITYYQLTQVKDEIQDVYRKTKSIKTEEEKIKKIINLLETEQVVLIGYQKQNWGGHAIIVYGVEYGSYTKNGVNYQGRLLTCDPNSSNKQNDETYIYFNTSTYNWAIPFYKAVGISSAQGAIINYISADINVINSGGYFDINRPNTITNASDDYISSLEMAAVSKDHSINKLSKSEGLYSKTNSGPNDIIPDIVYRANESETSIGTAAYLLSDSNSAYIVEQQTPEPFKLTLDYENCTLSASSKAGTEVIFDQKGYVSLKNENASYSIGMTYNESFYPTDWFFMGVSGENADKVELQKSENGYIMKSDNLENVKILAKNREVSPTAEFSTDYKEVFIYEIDENTIGVAIDSDDNGTYETQIETTSSDDTCGDVNGDYKVDAKDASMVLMAYAKMSTGSEDGLTEKQRKAANVNGDDKVDAKDASSILAYYALVSTASGNIPTMKDFMTPKQS